MAERNTNTSDLTSAGRHATAPYREAFAAMPAPLVVLDAQLRILDANDAYLMMLSLAREDLVGRFLFEVFPASEEAAADAVTAESVLRAAVATGTSQYLPVFQYDTETAPGSGAFQRRWWRMTATPCSARTVIATSPASTATSCTTTRCPTAPEPVTRSGLTRPVTTPMLPAK